MKIVAISNQKGGVAKTTTAVNLSACLEELGSRVLMVDLDPQANGTSALGVEPPAAASLYRPLLGEGAAVDKILPTNMPNLSIIPGELELAGVEIELARTDSHLSRLREVLEPLRELDRFDYVILDTPPSLGVIMTSALAAADEVLVPLQCEYFGLEGLSRIVHVVDEIRQSGANPDLHIEGILMTMYDSRTNLSQQVMADVRRHQAELVRGRNLSQQVVEDLRTHFSEVVYKTVIPRTVRIAEAPSFGQPIIQYDPNGRGAAAYRDMAKEFLIRHGQTPEEQPLEAAS